LVVACGISFFGGMQYQKDKQANTITVTAQGAAGLQGAPGGGGFRTGMRGIVGQVTAISATSISVQSIRTNQVQTLGITSATRITNNGQSAGIGDIKVGDSAIVRPSSTNTTEASQITLNPQLGGFGPGGGAQPAPQTNTQTN